MKIMLTVMLLSLFCKGNASSLLNDSTVSDSTKAKAGKTIRFSTRLHSTGFFNLSGRICSPTPAADFNFLVERKGYGISIFTVRDLYDTKSDNNFSFGIIYKRVVLSSRFSVTPNIGVVKENFGPGFGDRIFVIAAFKATPKLTIDETSLVANVLNRGEEKEWINRIRFIYSQTNQLQFILSNWHNNTVFDDNGYFSGSFQAMYNRIRLSDHLHAQTGVLFFVMAKNTEETPKQEKSGLLFTFAISVE
jgi:hypothetical protein